jgi:hypothetical protein
MWKSIIREKKTKETILMSNVSRNSEQDNRMMENGDKDKTGKHWGISQNRNGEKCRVDNRANIGMELEM